MIKDLPILISILFGGTVLAAMVWFYLACRSRKFLIGLVCWTVLQSGLGLSGVYQNVASIPPALVRYGILPSLLIIVLMFVTKNGRSFVGRLNLKTLTWFHVIRIPVEIVLVLLYYRSLIPINMTFEGTNFDIVSGLSAGFMAVFAFKGKTVNRKLLIAWNLLCLLLLINIVVISALAVPSPLQKIAFEQPNIAILYFPFNLLPTVIVPLVLFAHLVVLYKLTGVRE